MTRTMEGCDVDRAARDRRGRALIASAAVALVLLADAVHASGDVSQIRIGSLAANVSTATANSYYPTSLTSTREIWGPDPAANRPVEIKAMARALRNDPDLIYEYVHDNVRTTFIYGLQKGALGALVDQSGTPFDQAELMVELLRESGFSARYKAGTLRLSASQASAWLGSSTASAVQKILRDGGFPLDYNATGPTYTMGHVWVEVTIPGSSCNTTCWFDPSYKAYTFRPTLNLETLMGWSTNEFTTSAATNPNSFLVKSWTGLTEQGTTDPVWVSSIHDANLQSKLQAYATTLLTNLRTPAYAGLEIEDVIGGQDIVKTGATPVRNNATLPGFTTVVQRTWDCTGATTCGVPDPYRTRLTLTLLANPETSPALITKTLFADEVYGRRLAFDTPQAISLPDQPEGGSFDFWCVKLTVDAQPLANAQAGCDGSVNPLAGQRSRQVRIEVDHPYAATQPGIAGAPAGSYMDMSVSLGTHVQKYANMALPVVIVAGFGEASPALVSKIAAEQTFDRLLPVVDPPLATEPGDVRGDSSSDQTMFKIAASYLAQYSRMAELQKRLGNAEHVNHHLLGLLYAQATLENDWPQGQTDPSRQDWYVSDRALRINVDGAISVTSKTDTAADRRKVIQGTLAVAAALEGSVFEQMLDVIAADSTAARFQWGNANLGASLKYFLYTPATPAGQLGSGFTTLGCDPNWGGALAPISDYVNASKGFWAIWPSETCLGPGNVSGPRTATTLYRPSMQRGGALIAYQVDSSSVAHVVTSLSGVDSKGGGAGVPVSYAREFDAAGAAGLLKDKFEDRSRLHGIDLRSGQFTYTAPPDLSIGEGGFPYELALTRSFKPGTSRSPGLPNGWAHNLDVRASISGDGLAKLGQDSALAAAESIAAFYTAQKIYSLSDPPSSNPTPANLVLHLKHWVLVPFVVQWWASKLNQDVVTINAGHDARQFTRLADGTFAPPRNGVGTLTQGGARVGHQGQNLRPGDYDRWDYSPVAFTYTSPEKDVQAFSYFELNNGYNRLSGVSEKSSGRRHGWHLGSWTFSYGVTLSYTYQANNPLGIPAGEDRLVSVSNNLGRALTLGYAGTSEGVDLTSLTDGQARTVQYARATPAGPITSVTSAENETAKYDYVGDGQNMGLAAPGARPQPYPSLLRVYAPSDAIHAKLQVTYDGVWRAAELQDAVTILTPATRPPWRFYSTGTNRGARADPLDTPADHHEFTAYYDERGRAVKLIDEEARTYLQAFDNHDRVADRTYPEGNHLQLAYDEPTQQIKRLTRVKKSTSYWSGTLADIVVQATYDASCGRIKNVTDARGKVTTWNYNSTTCVLNSIQQPQVSNPQNGGTLATPQTSFFYDAFGQMTQITDPTARVVSFEYDPSTRYRLRRRVDPTGLNLVTTYGHDAYGDISSLQDPRLNTTTYSFDKQRRLTQVTAPLGAVTVNRYDADGDVYRVERAMGDGQWQLWNTSFTPTKKVYQQTSPTGAVTANTYDGLDRIDVVTDPDGRKVRTEYFKDGQTKRITRAYQSATMTPIVYATYTLTPNGQVDTVTDGNGNVTNLDYDGMDRPYRTFLPAPATGTPCAPALPHSTSAPSCASGQTYEELTYDPAGNVTAKRNRSGISLAFVFDDLNRETTRTVPDNPAVAGNLARTLTTSYDLAGRSWDATADSQTLSQRYDAAGRLDYVDDSYLGATNRRIDSGYDAAGNRTSLAYPGGTTVSFTFDALNRLDTVTEGGVTLADYDWDTLSRRDLVRFDNNTLGTNYGYEDDDDLSSIVQTGPAPLTWTLGRNASSQITGLTASDGAFLARPASTLNQAYSPNRLNQYGTVAGTAQAYDANGNLTGDGTYTFTFDEENRLRAASGAGTTASYEYDPLGRRRAKIVNGVTTKYASDGAEEIEERDVSQVVLRKYVYGAGIDDRIAMLDAACAGGGRCFYLTNWQGSATTLVNQDGTLNAVYHYGPYGEGTNWTPSDALTGNPFRYTGRRVDPETGLYYYRARYYSPKTGRFLQTDPIGTKDDLNLYAYVGNDPLDNTDPTGECPICALVGAAAAYTVSVGFQTYSAVSTEHKSLLSALATAATSKESAGAAVAGAIAGGTLGAGAAFVGGTTLAGTTAGAVAQVGLAAGAAVPATLASSAVTGTTPSGRDFAANAAGNVVGLATGAALGVIAKKATITAAVATMGSSDAVSKAAVVGTAAGGQVVKEGLSELASQSTSRAVSPPQVCTKSRGCQK